jgi:uncharacterized lipoprotein YddW (UPF0748 family)
MSRRAVLLCALLSLLLSLPSLLALPRAWPLHDPAVQRSAEAAVAELRTRGVWVADAEISGIATENGHLCFHWIYRYRSRTYTAQPIPLTTCP